MNINDWFIRWGIPLQAWQELVEILNEPTVTTTVTDDLVGKSERWSMSAIRLEARKRGIYLYRNNCGVDQTNGAFVRYGLANESKQMNQKIKSSDNIGFTPILITEKHLNQIIAVFTSVEVKRPGWKYTGTPREVAQHNWLNLTVACGGYATFATVPDDLDFIIDRNDNNTL